MKLTVRNLLLVLAALLLTTPALQAGLEEKKGENEERSRGRIAPRTADGKAAPAEDVKVGMYLAQAMDFSLLENRFDVDLYIWFRWQNPDLTPHASFELVNATVEEKEIQFAGKDGDSMLAVCRVQASIKQFWDVSRFPYDSHALQIAIEDHRTFRYQPDLKQSGTDKAATIPGWVIGQPSLKAGLQEYNSNFGETVSSPEDNQFYSRLTCSVPIRRDGWGYPLKLFIALYVAVGIALLGLWVRHDCSDGRIGMGGAALFAAVANEYIISSSLPNSSVFTIADKLHIVGVMLIFASLILSNIASRIDERGDNEKAQRLDRIAFYVLLGIACFAWGVIVL